MSPAVIGFLKGAAFAVVVALLSYFGDATNLAGILNPATASLVAAVVMSIEESMTASTGKAFFGSISIRR